MTPHELNANIAAGKYENYYFFIGPEEVKKREAMESIRRALLPEGLEALNETILENCSVGDIRDNAILMPVMCDRRIVLIRDWPPFAAGKNDNEESSAPAKKASAGKPADEMRAWLPEVPDSCILIFWFTKEPKKFIPLLPQCVNFTHLAGNELMEECLHILEPYGKTIRKDAFDELVMMSGQDLTRLTAELGKLAGYTQRSKTITKADVQAIATPSPEYSVFAILDRLLENNIREATVILNDLLKQSGNSPTFIISLFASSMRIYLMLKLAMEQNSDTVTLAKTLGITEGRRKFVLGRFKSASSADLKRRYEACVHTDTLVKSGLAKDKAALDALMLELLPASSATGSSYPSSK